MAKKFGFTLCADDYALSPGVSLGIRQALQAGRINATGCMTNMPFWPREAGVLAQLALGAEVGLHLNLTLGAPLRPMPLFARGGLLPNIGAIMQAARRKILPLEEIRSEVAAQLDAFAAHFGRAPDFFDGHQHVHILPGIAEIVLDELMRRQMAGKVWLRDSGDNVWRILRRRSALTKAMGLAWLARDFAGKALAKGFVANAGFAGFSAFDRRRDYGRDFARFLVAPGPQHLVMCHPGHVDDDLARLDRVTVTREQELAFLMSDRFWAGLDAGGAELALTTNPIAR